MNTRCLSIYLCLISFSSALQFSVHKSFASLVKFIPKYYILFDATVNGIVNFFLAFLKIYF